MALAHDDESLVASDLDVQIAVRRALGRIGMTYAELEQQARIGKFSSELARTTWTGLRDLGHVADSA